MSRKNKTINGTFTSTQPQRDAMKRRVAAYFRRHDGVILVKSGPGWKSDLIERLVREIRQVRGVRQRRAHTALVTEVVKRLADKSIITQAYGAATMTTQYMTYQANIEQHLREGRQPSGIAVKDRCHGRRSPQRKDRLIPTAA